MRPSEELILHPDMTLRTRIAVRTSSIDLIEGDV